MSETKAVAGGLQALFSRPRRYYENHTDESVVISSSPTEMVYIRACKNCQFRSQSKIAKCIIESCSDVKVAFEEAIMSGTLELIDCQNVTIFINPRDSLPTLSAERCNSLHLHYHTPTSLGSIYTVQSSDITVHFKPPHKEEHVLELPEGGGTDQFVSSLQGESIVTEKVVREGAGYATTAAKKADADRRQKELMRRFEQHLLSMFKVTPPPSSSSSSSAPQGQGPSGSGGSQAAAAAPALAGEGEKRKVVQLEQEEEEEEGEGEGEANPLAAALKAKRKGLKPTETVERHLPVVGTESGRSGRGFNPAIESDEEKREFFDSPEQLAKKVEQTVKWLKASQHAIIFTGAGVSTSCGIPDFRSGMNTVLDTGPGVWELRAHNSAPPKTARAVPLIRALPSPTHMAIVQLHKEGMAKFTVSQNVDGLHRRSGLGPAQLAELHGNTNLETCGKCKRQYLRDFETREAAHVFDHATSRRCDDPKCRGVLEDSIINFGENLPQEELSKAFSHAKQADLCIVLGSSLRVSPANHVPEEVLAHGGKVILCNLQRIPQFPADNRTLPVFCKCDEFMHALMERVGLQIPEFVLRRRVRLSLENKEAGEGTVVTATGLDVDEDMPYSFVRSLSAEYDGQTYTVPQEPLTLTLPPLTTTHLPLTLSFQGHYREPPMQLQFPVTPGNKVYNLSYHIKEGQWTSEEAV